MNIISYVLLNFLILICIYNKGDIKYAIQFTLLALAYFSVEFAHNSNLNSNIPL